MTGLVFGQNDVGELELWCGFDQFLRFRNTPREGNKTHSHSWLGLSRESNIVRTIEKDYTLNFVVLSKPQNYVLVLSAECHNDLDWWKWSLQHKLTTVRDTHELVYSQHLMLPQPSPPALATLFLGREFRCIFQRKQHVLGIQHQDCTMTENTIPGSESYVI